MVDAGSSATATDDIAGLEINGERRQLFIVLHAFCQNPDRLKPIRQAIRDAYPDADMYSPRLPFAGFWGWLCTDEAADVVRDLIVSIERIVAQRGDGYEAVNFVGHSMGAIFARKIAIIAHGEQQRTGADATLGAPFENQFAAFAPAPRSWAPLIQRIVLIAGMNRGWSTSSAMDWLTSFGWGVGIFFGEVLFAGSPIIFDIRQGAVFSVQTRLQWLALMHRPPEEQPSQRPAIVVAQLLGTVDDIVAPDDSVDYAVDDPARPEAQSYFYMEVPNSAHNDIVDLAVDADPAFATWQDPTPEQRRNLSAQQLREADGMGRYVWFRRALCLPREELQNFAVARDQMSDSLSPQPNWGVTDVVFVIHGIRDRGFWTRKIARAIKQQAAARKTDFRSFTASYGYFAMAPFVLWWIRRQKAEWLMDQYAETRAHYPRARFSYVGHSNGTYLVARALVDYPAARFERIVLAGSVVRDDYKWLEAITAGRVSQVLNYVATRDWVVAVFPKGLQRWPIFDLGGGGHDGFRDGSKQGPVYQIEYITGSHSAGHAERYWRDIAGFVVNDVIPVGDGLTQSNLVKTLGRFSTLILIAILLAVFTGGFLIAQPMLCKVPPLPGIGVCEADASAALSATTATWRTLATVVYFWLVYIVVSRV